jgi:hypothetical protein
LRESWLGQPDIVPGAPQRFTGARSITTVQHTPTRSIHLSGMAIPSR